MPTNGANAGLVPCVADPLGGLTPAALDENLWAQR
jgi:hypothetical protein